MNVFWDWFKIAIWVGVMIYAFRRSFKLDSHRLRVAELLNERYEKQLQQQRETIEMLECRVRELERQ